MNLVENNMHNGKYLEVAASSNQLPEQFAFNDSADPTNGLSNRDAISKTPAKGFCPMVITVRFYTTTIMLLGEDP